MVLAPSASLPSIVKPLPNAKQTLASCSLTPELQAQTLLLYKLALLGVLLQQETDKMSE